MLTWASTLSEKVEQNPQVHRYSSSKENWLIMPQLNIALKTQKC